MNKLTKLEKSWILYDVGNSAFTMLACSLIPIWFKAIAIGEGAGKISSDQATAYWAAAISIVTIIVAILGPVLGTFADYKDLRKPIFSTALGLGVLGTILLGFANSWLLFLIVFIVTKICYQSSLTSYDSMINDVTTAEKMDQVSSYGYAWGYIGSCLPFTVALVLYVLGEPSMGINLIPFNLAKILGCMVTAIWWLIVTIPLLKNYKQKYYVEKTKGAIAKVFKTLGHTIKTIATQNKKVFLFLLAFFLYIDGVGTIIDNCINIGTDLGLNTVGQVVFLLATQVVAWIFSLLFAQLSKKYDTVTLISVCIIGYTVVCLYALTLQTLLQFGIMAFMVGMFQGSIQSLSRSYYGKIIPANNAGEFFGIYDIFAKGASFLGSFVITWVKLAGGTINIAIGLLAFFFVAGLILLRLSAKVEA